MSQLNDNHREAIKELINIGFGRAMSKMADLLSTRVKLSVPHVEEVQPGHIVGFLMEAIGDDSHISLVQQSFYGDFLGEAVLAMPSSSGSLLVNLFAEEWGFTKDMDPRAMEQEMLMEVGNIVIGACLGQFAELLKTHVSFKPPHVTDAELSSDRFRRDVCCRDTRVLMVQTSFQVAAHELSGFLFFFISTHCRDWLLKELDTFLADLGIA